MEIYNWKTRVRGPIRDILTDTEEGSIIHLDDTFNSELAIIFGITDGIPFPGMAFIKKSENEFYVMDNTSSYPTFHLTTSYSAPFYQSDKVGGRSLEYRGTREGFIREVSKEGFDFIEEPTEFRSIVEDGGWRKRVKKRLE